MAVSDPCCDCALDFEPIAAIHLAEFAGEHSAAGAFKSNGGEIVALQGQEPANLKIGDVAETHRNLLQDSGHRQPRLLDAYLHQMGPAPIRGRRLGFGITREFGAKWQKKRLRQQKEAVEDAAAHAERKPPRRGLAIPPAKRVRILDHR